MGPKGEDYNEDMGVKHLFQISGGLSSCVHQSSHHPHCTNKHKVIWETVRVSSLSLQVRPYCQALANKPYSLIVKLMHSSSKVKFTKCHDEQGNWVLNLAQLNHWPQRNSALQQGINTWHESITNRQATLASDIFACLSRSTKTKDPTYHSQVNWSCFVVSLFGFAYCFWANSCSIGQVGLKLLILLLSLLRPRITGMCDTSCSWGVLWVRDHSTVLTHSVACPPSWLSFSRPSLTLMAS